MSSTCSQVQLKLNDYTLATFPHGEGGQEAGSLCPRYNVHMVLKKAIIVLSTQTLALLLTQRLDFPCFKFGCSHGIYIFTARLKQSE
jgi:hypothetical protein